MLVGAVLAQLSQAQNLKVTVKEKAWQAKAIFVNHGEFAEMHFDNTDTWTYDVKDDKPQEAHIFLVSKGLFVPVLLEQGKQVSATVTGKSGKPVVTYGGDNKLENRFLYEYLQFNPEKSRHDKDAYADMDDEEMRKEAEKREIEDISFDEAFARLDKRLATTLKAAKAVKDPQRQAKYIHLTHLRDLANRIALNELRIYEQQLDKKTDAEYLRLIGLIDPNDEMGLDQIFRLPQTLIDSKNTKNASDVDQTAYSLEYLSLVDRYITNSQVRHTLLCEFASQMFNKSFSGQVFELDKFWEAFKRIADREAIDQFQYVVDSRRNTAVGKPCPDVTFSDPDGKSHRLSHYFGKYLYIDIWATWCSPCCAEIPYIEKHVERYRNDPRIAFLSISIDTKLQAWKQKLEKDKPTWPQFHCNKDENRILCEQWGVTGIPRFIIIAPDGTIADPEAFRPSDQQFDEKLERIISQRQVSQP